MKRKGVGSRGRMHHVDCAVADPTIREGVSSFVTFSSCWRCSLWRNLELLIGRDIRTCPLASMACPPPTINKATKPP